MSDESIPPAQDPSPDTAPTPKVRRISNRNPKKAAKAAKENQVEEHAVPIEEFDSTPPTGDESREGKTEKSGEQKRKNRRRRGKGKPSQMDGETSGDSTPVSEETINLADTDAKEPDRRNDKQGERKEQQTQRPPQKQRSKPDVDKIAKNAWKIFLAEVGEEGVALIADNDARELARRCFRLSEIFLEEEGRRN